MGRARAARGAAGGGAAGAGLEPQATARSPARLGSARAPAAALAPAGLRRSGLPAVLRGRRVGQEWGRESLAVALPRWQREGSLLNLDLPTPSGPWGLIPPPDLDT